MSNRNVNRLIDKTRFRTYKKVKKPVQERFQQLTDKQLKTIVDNRIHDKIISNRRKRIYQLKIFLRFFQDFQTHILPTYTITYQIILQDIGSYLLTQIPVMLLLILLIPKQRKQFTII